MCCVVTLFEELVKWLYILLYIREFIFSSVNYFINGGIYSKYINAYIRLHYYKLCRGILDKVVLKFCRDYMQCIWLRWSIKS